MGCFFIFALDRLQESIYKFGLSEVLLLGGSRNFQPLIRTHNFLSAPWA